MCTTETVCVCIKDTFLILKLIFSQGETITIKIAHGASKRAALATRFQGVSVDNTGNCIRNKNLEVVVDTFAERCRYRDREDSMNETGFVLSTVDKSDCVRTDAQIRADDDTILTGEMQATRRACAATANESRTRGQNSGSSAIWLSV